MRRVAPIRSAMDLVFFKLQKATESRIRITIAIGDADNFETSVFEGSRSVMAKKPSHKIHSSLSGFLFHPFWPRGLHFHFDEQRDDEAEYDLSPSEHG